MIIVDDLQHWGRTYRSGAGSQAERVGARNGDMWCHLSSTPDDVGFAELHLFAARVGLRRAWFQGDHYDLTPTRRAMAVRCGAAEVTRLEMSMVLLYDRKGRERPAYGTPDKTARKPLEPALLEVSES